MQAVVAERYGSPDSVELREVERPEIADDGVLVRVRAASVNRADYYRLVGTPYVARPMLGGLRRPSSPLLGSDFAGTVEAVGEDVRDLRPGDEVFGVKRGAFAEYVCVREAVVAKPANATFEEAAAVPIAALTALQGLRDAGRLRPGQKVLVNGASGGVGTFAVQIAKALGAEVTAVCSTRNVELVRALGADRVVDYAVEDFTRGGGPYDLLFDNAGSRRWRACARVLAPRATVVLCGGPNASPVFGPLLHLAGMRLASLLDRRRAAFFVATPSRADLDVLRAMVEAGAVRPVVERVYPLSEAAEALRAMGEGHARGKLVLAL